MLLGGAALTRTYVERDLREVYEGRLFYGKDAFEGLHTMDTLMEGKRTGALDPDFGRALGGRDLPPRKSRACAAERAVDRRRRRAPTSPPTSRSSRRRSSAPRVAKGIPLDDIAAYINETALFRNQWQFRPDKTRQRDRRRVQGADPRRRCATELDARQGRGLARARGRRGATSR